MLSTRMRGVAVRRAGRPLCLGKQGWRGVCGTDENHGGLVIVARRKLKICQWSSSIGVRAGVGVDWRYYATSRSHSSLSQLSDCRADAGRSRFGFGTTVSSGVRIMATAQRDNTSILLLLEATGVSRCRPTSVCHCHPPRHNRNLHTNNIRIVGHHPHPHRHQQSSSFSTASTPASAPQHASESRLSSSSLPPYSHDAGTGTNHSSDATTTTTRTPTRTLTTTTTNFDTTTRHTVCHACHGEGVSLDGEKWRRSKIKQTQKRNKQKQTQRQRQMRQTADDEMVVIANQQQQHKDDKSTRAPTPTPPKSEQIIPPPPRMSSAADNDNDDASASSTPHNISRTATSTFLQGLDQVLSTIRRPHFAMQTCSVCHGTGLRMNTNQDHIHNPAGGTETTKQANLNANVNMNMNINEHGDQDQLNSPHRHRHQTHHDKQSGAGDGTITSSSSNEERAAFMGAADENEHEHVYEEHDQSNNSNPNPPQHDHEHESLDFSVSIVGGGIGGCALALALCQRGISCQLFERDEHAHQRSQGYGLTLQQVCHVITRYLLHVLMRCHAIL
jgi:hypothetical protein